MSLTRSFDICPCPSLPANAIPALSVPTLILPPLALSYLQRKKVVPSSGLWARAADLTLIGTSLLVFLPPAIATFPQVATVSPSKLESRFHDIKDEHGNRVDKLEFNKGL